MLIGISVVYPPTFGGTVCVECVIKSEINLAAKFFHLIQISNGNSFFISLCEPQML